MTPLARPLMPSVPKYLRVMSLCFSSRRRGRAIRVLAVATIVPFAGVDYARARFTNRERFLPGRAGFVERARRAACPLAVLRRVPGSEAPRELLEQLVRLLEGRGTPVGALDPGARMWTLVGQGRDPLGEAREDLPG